MKKFEHNIIVFNSLNQEGWVELGTLLDDGYDIRNVTPVGDGIVYILFRERVKSKNE